MQSANGDEYLFVVGGYNGGELNTLQIYDISSGQWMSSPTPPTMQTARRAFACIAHEDILYAIGGHDYLSSLCSIETLFIGNDLADIVSGSGQWSYFEDGELSVGVYGARAVAYGALILIAGGYADPDSFPTHIHIIDTLSKSITVDADNSLVYCTNYPAAIVADRVWYMFGGRDGSTITSKYQYMILGNDQDPINHGPSDNIKPVVSTYALTTLQPLTTTHAVTTFTVSNSSLLTDGPLVYAVLAIMSLVLVFCVICSILLVFNLKKRNIVAANAASQLSAYIYYRDAESAGVTEGNFEQEKQTEIDLDVLPCEEVSAHQAVDDGHVLCIICCERKANIFNDPCGHVTYCHECTSKSAERDALKKCPSCRADIVECKQMFLAGFSQ